MKARGDNFASSGGRPRARRFFAWTTLLILGVVAPAAAQAAAPVASVREERGLYSVSAEFSASGSPDVVLATLSDYDSIPRFMPAVTHSRIVERSDEHVVVEQEAVASFLMFSRRIHLMLDVSQRPGTIHFTDRCGRSFERYEGTWTVADRDGLTVIVYRLAAKPAFDVPAFLLKRLLKRDAVEMIEHLQKEIAARSVRR
jgi:ribosome-associated toxin RatA of RatAB toxin-antitoxin module